MTLTEQEIPPIERLPENPSGLDPRGVAVLICPLDVKPKGGLIELPPQAQERLQTVENQAIVIAIGPSAWHDEKVPRAKIGETVLVTRFAGFMVTGPKDGEAYRLVNDRDIFCAITGDGDE